MKRRQVKKVVKRHKGGRKYRGQTIGRAKRHVAAKDHAAKRLEYEADVRRPGKFEGEARYVPYFWDMYLEGFADDDEDGVLTFDVDAKDRALFPELRGVKQVRLYESDVGFVGEA